MNEELIHILNIIFNILGVAAFISSVQFKEKKSILLVQFLASMFYFASYLLVGATSGYITELIEGTKDLAFYGYEEKGKKIPLALLIGFVLLLIVVAILTFDGLYSIAPLCINLAYFISSYFKNPKYIRLTVLICAFVWIYYNFTVGTYFIIIGNIFEIASSSIALMRFKQKEKNPC